MSQTPTWTPPTPSMVMLPLSLAASPRISGGDRGGAGEVGRFWSWSWGESLILQPFSGHSSTQTCSGQNDGSTGAAKSLPHFSRLFQCSARARSHAAASRMHTRERRACRCWCCDVLALVIARTSGWCERCACSCSGRVGSRREPPQHASFSSTDA